MVCRRQRWPDIDATYSAYSRIGSAEYVEVFGLDFEQFEKGQVFRHIPGLTISAQDNTDESLDTQNAARIHYDGHYASKTEFERPLVVSTLTLQKCFGLIWKTFARKDRIVSFSSIKMKSPVYAGATLYAETTVLDVEDADDDCGEVSARIDTLNESGTVVASVECRTRIYRRGRHPYYSNMDAEFDLPDKRFLAYRKESDGVLVEQTGLFFDEFEVGECFHHRPEKYFHESESLEHARRSMDWNPRFSNPTFSKSSFGEESSPISELYSIGAITASTTRTFGRVVANLAWNNVDLQRLLYPGETISTYSKIVDKKDSHSRPGQGILTVSTTAIDGEGRQIMTFDRVLLVYRKDQELSCK